MLNLFIDYRQNIKIGEAQAKAQSAYDKAEHIFDYIRTLELQINEQRLIIQAIAELIISKNVCTKEELFAIIAEVDGRDGLVDGKIAGNAKSKCESCGRLYNVKINKCQYCGNVHSATSTIANDYKNSLM